MVQPVELFPSTEKLPGILVVDDDREFADSICHLLDLEGYETRASYSARQTLDMIESFDPGVAILDLQLGDGTGLDLVEPLKRRHPDLLCILATAHANIGTAVDALRQDIYDYFAKPLDPKELLATVERCYEKLRLQQAERAADKARREAAKILAVTQIAGGVSHHFNNLLAVLAGNLELLEESLVLNQRQEKMFAASQRAVDRAVEINDSLIVFARQQMTVPSIVNIDAVLRGCLSSPALAAAPSVSVEAIIEPGLPLVGVDAEQLQQALGRLLSNALESMPDGGTIKLVARSVEPDAFDWPEGGVCLSMIDSGQGMAPDVLERAIEPFFSSRGMAESSGLGLSAVYGFVKQLGGEVQITSREGKGTTVDLYFPAGALR